MQAAGREVCFVKLKESDDFALDWQALEAELRGGELVLLGPAEQSHGPGAGRRCCSWRLAARHPHDHVRRR